jgi:hypothetical protein
MTQTIAILGVGITLSLESGTAQVITSPPTALVKKYSTTYNYKKYLWIPQYNIHIIGTASVSDWFMRESYWMVSNVMGAMRTERRAAFSGFQALLVTNLDPDLKSLGISLYAGHRNTGMNGWSMFNEAMVCAAAVDTIRPYETPVFRGWETPIHEFGHAVELTLGLRSTTIARRQANGGQVNTPTDGELYAWAVEQWFAVRPGSVRSNLPTWERNYLAEVFNISNAWSPAFTQRPQALPVGPLGFTYGCGEGQGLNLGVVAHDLAYGANGNFAYRTNRTGIVFFNVPTFGYDPYLNVLKSGFYRLRSNIVPPPGYTLCADEGGSYTLPGLSAVAYGSNGNFKFFRGQPGGSRITFNPTVFGGDPNYGVLKNGFYKLGSSL